MQRRYKSKSQGPPKKATGDLSDMFNAWENPLYGKKLICTMSDLQKYELAYREFDLTGIWTGFCFLDPRTGELQGFTNTCPNGGHELTFTGKFFGKSKECIQCQMCNWTYDFESGSGFDEDGYWTQQSLRPLIMNLEDDNVYFYMDGYTFRRPGIGSLEVGGPVR